MKKKYVKPSIHVVITGTESLLNGGSIVDAQGNTQDQLGSDTSTGGTESGDGYVYGDAKHNSWSSSWDERWDDY